MAQLAIKRDPIRGQEIIEIFKMLGGKCVSYNCLCSQYYYYIDKYNNITGITEIPNNNTFIIYTFEEFLKKFPYKLGDKVYYNNRICNIIEIRWNSSMNTISYGVYDGQLMNLALVEELKPYKEETMERKIESFEILETHCADEVKIEFNPSKFEMVEKKRRLLCS